MSTPTDAYIRDRVAQLEAACANRDGALATDIIRVIEADGYQDLADQLVHQVINQGLQAMAGGAR